MGFEKKCSHLCWNIDICTIRKPLAPEVRFVNTHMHIHTISSRLGLFEFIQTSGKWLAISYVTSSNGFSPPWLNMSFLCQEFFPSVCVSSDIYEGLSLKCFVFNHRLPKCPRHEMGQASIRDFESVPKVPTWQGSGCCKMPLKRPFLQLARIQWHLVVVDTFLWKMEDILFSFPVLWMEKI